MHLGSRKVGSVTWTLGGVTAFKDEDALIKHCIKKGQGEPELRTRRRVHIDTEAISQLTEFLSNLSEMFSNLSFD